MGLAKHRRHREKGRLHEHGTKQAWRTSWQWAGKGQTGVRFAVRWLWVLGVLRGFVLPTAWLLRLDGLAVTHRVSHRSGNALDSQGHS